MKRIHKQKLSVVKNIKNTGTSSPHFCRNVNRFIIQNALKVTGITLEILGKESKL